MAYRDLQVQDWWEFTLTFFYVFKPGFSRIETFHSRSLSQIKGRGP